MNCFSNGEGTHVHKPTGFLCEILRSDGEYSFCNFGDRSNPFNWIRTTDLAPWNNPRVSLQFCEYDPDNNRGTVLSETSAPCDRMIEHFKLNDRMVSRLRSVAASGGEEILGYGVAGIQIWAIGHRVDETQEVAA